MSPESRSTEPDSSAARVEAFSDAVFAFAATLLVVALEVPSTVAELRPVLLGFIPFALSFGALVLIWSVHRAYFRRFPTVDRITIALNSCLLFVVLFYVYPLKFLTRGMASMLIGPSQGGGGLGITSFDDLGELFVWYGAGFSALFGLVALLYRHGARRAPRLELGARETREARFLARHYGIFMLVGLLSTALAGAGVGLRIGMPGWIFALTGPLCALHGAWNGQRERRIAI